MTVSEVTIEKYLRGITSITATIGKLDVLRLSLKEKYNDEIADTIILSIIKDLSNVSGVDYKPINIDIKPKEVVGTQIFMPKKEHKNNDNVEQETVENNNKNINRCIYTHEQQKTQSEPLKKNIVAETLATLERKKADKIENKGIYYNNKGEMEYDFIYSTSLKYMRYNRQTRDLIMRFKNNMRTYKYKDVNINIFDNLHIRDEENRHAGKYFAQQVRNKFEYEEITDFELIG